jgi:hypothetical protein
MGGVSQWGGRRRKMDFEKGIGPALDDGLVLGKGLTLFCYAKRGEVAGTKNNQAGQEGEEAPVTGPAVFIGKEGRRFS